MAWLLVVIIGQLNMKFILPWVGWPSFLALFFLFGEGLSTISAQTADSFNPGVGNQVTCLGVQTDGKILVGGFLGGNLGGERRTAIGRVFSDGAIEGYFKPVLEYGLFSTAVQEDNKVVIGGYFTLARYTKEGLVDSSFQATISQGDPYPYVACLVVQPDGKLIVGGEFRSLNGGSQRYFGRLHSNGALDSSFSTFLSGGVRAVALQPDGKMIISGSFTNLVAPGQGNQPRHRVARLHSNGTLDTTFNAATPAAGSSTFFAVYCFALQPDGKILTGGSFAKIGEQPCYSLGRLNTNGTLDSSFNAGSVFSGSEVNSLALQADGKILVGARNRVVRLSSNGTQDGFSAYALHQNVVTPVQSIALQPDGKILVAGVFTNLAGQTRTNIGRLNNDTTATQSLIYTNNSVTWFRGGSSPEIWRAAFYFTTNDLEYTLLAACRT